MLYETIPSICFGQDSFTTERIGKCNTLIQCIILSKCTLCLKQKKCPSERSPKIILHFTSQCILRNGISCILCISFLQTNEVNLEGKEGQQKPRKQQEGAQRSSGCHSCACTHRPPRGVFQGLKLLLLLAGQVQSVPSGLLDAESGSRDAEISNQTAVPFTASQNYLESGKNP